MKKRTITPEHRAKMICGKTIKSLIREFKRREIENLK